MNLYENYKTYVEVMLHLLFFIFCIGLIINQYSKDFSLVLISEVTLFFSLVLLPFIFYV